MAAAQTTTIARAYPKRKRAAVSYCESDLDEGEGDESDVSIDEGLPRKKLKTSTKTISTRPLPKKKIFPFTSLPAELKNQIYDLALRDTDGIFLISKTRQYRRTVQREVRDMDGNQRRSQYLREWQSPSPTASSGPSPKLRTLIPKILLLNKQIYSETQPILYGGNAFAFEDTTAMHAFLANIGDKNCGTLTDLTIKGWGYTKAHKALNHPAFTMLARAVSLTHLHIDCRIAWGCDPRRIARQLYRDGHHWFEAVGLAKGKSDAAIDIIEVCKTSLQPVGGGYYGVSPKKSSEETLEEFRGELRKLLR